MWLARKARTVPDSRLGVWKRHEVLEPPLKDFSPDRNISISDLPGAHFGEGGGGLCQAPECFKKQTSALAEEHRQGRDRLSSCTYQ